MQPFEDDLAHPRELLRPCLLLLLAEEPGHGYDLMARLKPFGFDWGGPGPIYRELRLLEGGGLVRSSWEAPGAGPARHVYELTPAGAVALGRCSSSLDALGDLLTDYRGRYQRLSSAAETPTPGPGPGPPRAAPPGPSPSSGPVTPEPPPEPGPAQSPPPAKPPDRPPRSSAGRMRFRRR